MTARPDGQTQTHLKGLLESIAENPLDDDYYEVRAGRYSRSRGLSTTASAIVLALFGGLLTIAALQTRQERPANLLERQSLIADITARKDTLASRQRTATKLDTDVAALRASTDRSGTTSGTLGVVAGDTTVEGEGIMVTVDPGPGHSPDAQVDDSDLQLLVNAFWGSGAEAVALNDNRVGTLTSIHQAGGGMTVNYRSIGAPYRFTVIGDSDALDEEFTDGAAGTYWKGRGTSGGIRFSVKRESELVLPALPSTRSTLIHAKPSGGSS